MSLYNGFGPFSIATFASTTESSQNCGFGSSNVTDLNQDTYWESTNNVFPDWVQVDLGITETADADRAAATSWLGCPQPDHRDQHL